MLLGGAEAPYTSLAAIYDTLTADYDYEQWVSCVLQLYRSLRGSPTDHMYVLDAGCGTGRAMAVLLDRGCRVVGVDASTEMLALAAARLAERRPLLISQDVRQLDLGQQRFDLVMSLCDSLNYLLSLPDLTTAIRRMASHLLPGGVLVFDMNTAHKLATVYGDHSYIEEGPGFFLAWENTWQPSVKMVEMRLSLFTCVEHAKRCLWERTDETHRERAYNPCEVVEALRNVGFGKIIGPLAAFTLEDARDDSERVFYAAQLGS